MTDFDYDVYQKKSLARSAAHKKNGSKSKKCSLPSDYLTNKELKERNGTVLQYNLNAPMTWKVFKSLDDDIQTEYINSLIEKYHIGMNEFCKMLGISTQTYYNHNIHFRFPHKTCGMTEEEEFLWLDFLTTPEFTPADETQPIKKRTSSRPEPMTVKPAQTHPESVPTIQVKTETPKPRKMSMSSIQLHFNGELDINSIAGSLKLILGDSSVGDMSIVCNLESNTTAG